MNKLFFLFVISVSFLSAAEHPWYRRATAAFACAASTADYATTLQVIGSGGIETNPLLLNKVGVIDTKRFLGVKIGVCMATILVEEIPHLFRLKNADQWDRALIPINMIVGTTFGSIAYHNRNVYFQQKIINAQNSAAASGILATH